MRDGYAILDRVLTFGQTEFWNGKLNRVQVFCGWDFPWNMYGNLDGKIGPSEEECAVCSDWGSARGCGLASSSYSWLQDMPFEMGIHRHWVNYRGGGWVLRRRHGLVGCWLQQIDTAQ